MVCGGHHDVLWTECQSRIYSESGYYFIDPMPLHVKSMIPPSCTNSRRSFLSLPPSAPPLLRLRDSNSSICRSSSYARRSSNSKKFLVPYAQWAPVFWLLNTQNFPQRIQLWMVDAGRLSGYPWEQSHLLVTHRLGDSMNCLLRTGDNNWCRTHPSI